MLDYGERPNHLVLLPTKSVMQLSQCFPLNTLPFKTAFNMRALEIESIEVSSLKIPVNLPTTDKEGRLQQNINTIKTCH